MSVRANCDLYITVIYIQTTYKRTEPSSTALYTNDPAPISPNSRASVSRGALWRCVTDWRWGIVNTYVVITHSRTHSTCVEDRASSSVPHGL